MDRFATQILKSWRGLLKQSKLLWNQISRRQGRIPWTTWPNGFMKPKSPSTTVESNCGCMPTPTLGWTRSKKASWTSSRTALLHSQDTSTDKYEGSYILQICGSSNSRCKKEKCYKLSRAMNQINMSASHMLSLRRLNIFCMYCVAHIVDIMEKIKAHPKCYHHGKNHFGFHPEPHNYT